MDSDRTFVAKRRRAKVVYVPMSFLSLLFGGGLLTDRNKYITVPVIEGIPADAVLVMIMACPERDAIELTYIHESFQPVTEGCMVPAVEVREITFRKVKVQAVSEI